MIGAFATCERDNVGNCLSICRCVKRFAVEFLDQLTRFGVWHRVYRPIAESEAAAELTRSRASGREAQVLPFSRLLIIDASDDAGKINAAARLNKESRARCRSRSSCRCGVPKSIVRECRNHPTNERIGNLSV